MCSKRAAAPATVPVWSPAVRALHWALVGCVGLGWSSGWGWLALHEAHGWLGYGALGLVGLRLALGRWGQGAARFGQFVRGAAATAAYGRALLAGRSPRYRGHNPLGGWMIVGLLATVTALAGSGALLDTDAFWGDALLGQVHAALAWLLLALVGVHLGGVALMSLAHREALVLAMVTGRKRRLPAADDSELGG